MIMILKKIDKNEESEKLCVNYLGCIFKKDGENKGGIIERTSKYSRGACAFYPILKDGYIPTEAKKTIFESTLVPILSYTSESWTLTSKDWSRIQ